METVTSADGTEIAYEQRGDGPPMVLVHGTGGSRRSWYPVLPHLTDDFTTVVPDRRGRGESGDGERSEGGEYSLQREVEDVQAVIDAVDGEPVLFGHSFGGLVAIEVARQTELDGLVLYEPALMTGDHRETADAAGRIGALLEDGQREDAVKLAFREMSDVEDVEALPVWPAVLEKAEAIHREFETVEEYRVYDDLSVDVPALLLTGDESQPFLRDGVHVLHDALDESRLVEFEGVGHVFNETAPDRVAAEIRSYVGQARP